MKKIYFISVILIFCITANAQSWQDTTALIEKIFTNYKLTNPGCQLAISRNGQIIFSKAWGLADLEHNVLLTNESLIEAGSVSKQFTAACILLLEQQGKLSLNDNIRKYIPELPDYGMPVLLKNMIHHTSGIKDWKDIVALAGSPEGDKVYDNDDVLNIISLQKTLNFKPEAEFSYSNSNYNLLAIVVQRVSGMELDEFSRKYIFEPAGMKHTRWRNHFRDVVPNRAIAYGYNGNFYFTDMVNGNAYGNGGLLTTAEDLLAWNNYYLSGKFGNPSLLSKQLETNQLNNGFMNNYSAGLFINSAMGRKVIIHDGSTAGYRCSLSAFPDLGLSFAWLSNTSQFDADMVNIYQSVWKIFIKDAEVKDQKNIVKAIPISLVKLNSDTGYFSNIRSGEPLRLFIKGEKLITSTGQTLTPVAENIFMLDDWEKIEVRKNKNDLLLIKPRMDTIKYVLVEQPLLTAETIKDYVGEYYSEEAQIKFSVLIKDDKLMLRENRNDDETLEPVYKDGFTYWRGTVYFERDKQNKITDMKISLPRTRNIEFKKEIKAVINILE